MKRYLLTIAAAALMLLFGQPADAQSSTFFDALKYYNERNVPESAKLFLKEISENPQNDAAYYYYANLLLSDTRNQDIKKIEDYLKKAVELSPENYWYKYGLASFYQQTERPELCTALLEKLLKEHPKKSVLYFDAANAYLQQNEIDKAIESLDKIAMLSGMSEAVCLNKMELLIKKNGNEKEAYEYLEKCYEDCKTARLASMLGDWYHSSYRDSLALLRYDEAIELDKGFSPAYFGRAHVYEALRQYDNYFLDIRRFMTDESLPATAKTQYIENLMGMPQFVVAFTPELDTLFSETQKVHPQDSMLANTLSLYYYKSGRNDQAIEQMRRNFELYPDSYPIGFQYLLMLYYSDELDDVINQSTVLLQKWPDIQDALLVRASAFRLKENIQAAIADYEKFASANPKDSAAIMSAYPALGDMYFQDGNVRKAFKCYEKALSVDPENSLVLNNYAYYMSLGKIKLKKAREMSRKTIEKEPDNPTYLDTYAWILHLMGQDVEAKAIFKHAMLYGGKEQCAILDHYAEVLYSLKEFDLAYIYWNQAKVLARGDEIAKIDNKVKERKAQQNSK